MVFWVGFDALIISECLNNYHLGDRIVEFDGEKLIECLPKLYQTDANLILIWHESWDGIEPTHISANVLSWNSALILH
jgi:hypothetical protein